MNIAVDAGVLGEKREMHKGGVYVACLNLLRELSLLDTKNTYTLYSYSRIPAAVTRQFGPNFHTKVLTPTRFWLYLRVSMEIVRTKPDMFLGFGQALPMIAARRSILFVYDLAFEHYPHFYPDAGKRLHGQTKRALEKATSVVAISEATKQDILTRYPKTKGSIRVIPLAAESIFSPVAAEEREKRLKALGIPEPYFLFVGPLKKMKNIKGTLAAFARARQEQEIPHRLVVTGNDSALDAETALLLAQMTEAGSVIRAGFVSRSDLPALYCGATALVAPSFYEGFGLPVLEAFACGCPVITSRAGAVAEVAGDAALFVNPSDTAEIASAIVRVARDPALAQRLRQLGERRAQSFSWEKSAALLSKFLGL